MKAILLTAGFGSRLRPLTDVLPKCLLPINGRPLLEYWFSMLSSAGVTPILMNLHYLPQIMKDWVQLTEYAQNVTMVYEESLLGTGGTLYQNRNFVGDEPVMLIHADNLCSTDMKAYIDAHKNRPQGTEITMMTFDTPTPETCGIVDVDHLGIVQAFHEKVAHPPGNHANAAVYIVEPSVINFLASLNKSFIDFSTEVLPAYIGEIYTFHNANYHRDIGNSESYLLAQIEFPDAVKGLDGNKGWEAWCKKNIDMLNNDFLKAFASAYHADIIDADEWLAGQIDYSIINGDGTIIIHCRQMKNAVEKLPRFIETNKLNKENIILFFREVPRNFSSRSLFEKTQLKSLALYATDN
jgi:Nucleoside-diphosphate-sugar pyrophosphorylase involved in lipopolysaccharide biosynthesis/translation initiation factor 2B, gamma/epsilon subunits (eIF-2Bgamma/eIF-2Bepsilon)